MRLKLKRWVSNTNFNSLSWTDGSLTKLVRQHKLKEGEAIVLTSLGWHRLRLVARLGNRAVMLIPETSKTPMQTLVRWAGEALRDGVVMLDEWKALQDERGPWRRKAA